MARKTGFRIIPVSGSSVSRSKRRAGAFFLIADARAYLSNSAAAEPMSAKREPHGPRIPSHDPRVISPGTGTGTSRKKTGRSIRCPARIRPQKARTGFGPNGQADGRQPFMPRVSHNPCLLMLPFRFAHAMRMRPLSVGRVDNAFHPATGSHAMVWLFCKEFSLKSLSEMTAPFASLSRSGGRNPRVQTTRPRARRTFRLSLSRNAFIGLAHAYADWCRRVSPWSRDDSRHLPRWRRARL